MGRALRVAPGGYVYHILNRANGRVRIFQKKGDYEAFERILEESLEHVPGMRILTYCLMPTHWHLVVRPKADGELSRFTGYLTLTHTQRWHAHHRNFGTGHLYQGRYKSFPIAADDYFLTVCRYVERNALRAGLVERAENWRWGGLWRRTQGNPELVRILSDWPVSEPENWVGIVNEPQTEAELEALRTSVRRGRPFGAETWSEKIAKKLGLENTFRSRGRPKKPATDPNKGS